MNKKYKRNSKSLVLLLSICLAILLIAIAVIIRFYSIRVLLTALVCAIIPFAFITIYTIMGAGDYIEIHDDFFVFKQGRNSPRKVYWKEISGLAFSGMCSRKPAIWSRRLSCYWIQHTNNTRKCGKI